MLLWQGGVYKPEHILYSYRCTTSLVRYSSSCRPLSSWQVRMCIRHLFLFSSGKTGILDLKNIEQEEERQQQGTYN